jgi:hypothetical protein
MVHRSCLITPSFLLICTYRRSYSVHTYERRSNRRKAQANAYAHPHGHALVAIAPSFFTLINYNITPKYTQIHYSTLLHLPPSTFHPVQASSFDLPCTHPYPSHHFHNFYLLSRTSHLPLHTSAFLLSHHSPEPTSDLPRHSPLPPPSTADLQLILTDHHHQRQLSQNFRQTHPGSTSLLRL